jgi:hypothetical protein
MRVKRAACHWRIARVSGRQVLDRDNSLCMHWHRAARYRQGRKQRCELGIALLSRPPPSGRRWEYSPWLLSKREAELAWLGDPAQASCQFARSRWVGA